MPLRLAGDEEVFEVFKTIRVVMSSSTAGVVQSMLSRIDGPVTGDVTISPTAGVFYYMLHRRGRFDGGVLVTNGAVICSLQRGRMGEQRLAAQFSFFFNF